MRQYLPQKARDLFELFCLDRFAGVRFHGYRLGMQYGFDLSGFFSRMDDRASLHSENDLGGLCFLKKYTPSYHVDFSDDLSSAVVYHPDHGEPICLEYDSGDDFTPYTVCFSVAHVHLEDIESVQDWIDAVLHEELCAAAFYKNEELRLAALIECHAQEDLTYKLLEQRLGYFGVAKLHHVADRFKIRSFFSTYDADGEITVENGNASLNMKV